ncbi:glycosyltransferase [Pseudooceanicola sp. 216_PA32_1]|uniref:Glycosyltransferase n=1 Tax=Pseudooceanicola pacificus TaxID=2676438 RepID=A0A844VYK3_9RHOB|nr:glycosyltransferase [Pseudooceanicola pacificus]MWB76816.1 glycosyltransferase [Pseudooceanicola pacificus]
MTAPAVSVVVVSRARPDRLRLCLTGLSRLHYEPYEIVVVADAQGMAVLRDMGLEDEVKTVAFDEPNISRARNLGIGIASGEIVAFIDDDAVPEPTWLTQLTRGFEWPEAAASGGYVRGRNGISFQWRARTVDRTGTSAPLDLEGDSPVLLTPADGRAIKTEGTNMAVRRTVLAELGGFDPAFAFYLDETDLNMRLAARGHATAIVPLAEVHHAFAASTLRAENRAPRDLYDIGASTAVFLRKHCPNGEHRQVVAKLRAERRRTLLEHMRDGRLEPRDVRRLTARLEAGLAAGRVMALEPMPEIPHSPQWFLPFETRATGRSVVISGRLIRRKALREQAVAAAQTGDCVTLLLFSRSTLRHRVRLTRDAVWEQTGGLWGASTRSQPAMRMARLARRTAEEVRRIARQRGLDQA